jgi:hypothetical protein
VRVERQQKQPVGEVRQPIDGSPLDVPVPRRSSSIDLSLVGIEEGSAAAEEGTGSACKALEGARSATRLGIHLSTPCMSVGGLPPARWQSQRTSVPSNNANEAQAAVPVTPATGSSSLNRHRHGPVDSTEALLSRSYLFVAWKLRAHAITVVYCV